MANILGFRGLWFPEVVAGISTINCGLCKFEICYVSPEEINSAYVAMIEHFHSKHPKQKVEDIPITVTNH